MSKRTKTANEIENEIKNLQKELQKTKAIEKAKTDNKILKAIKDCNAIGMFNGEPQDWDNIPSILQDWRNKKLAKLQREQSQNDANTNYTESHNL